MDFVTGFKNKVAEEVPKLVPGIFDSIRSMGKALVDMLTDKKNLAIFLALIAFISLMALLGVKIKREMGPDYNIFRGLGAMLSKMWTDFTDWLTGKNKVNPLYHGTAGSETPNLTPLGERPMADNIEYSIIPEFEKKKGLENEKNANHSPN